MGMPAEQKKEIADGILAFANGTMHVDALPKLMQEIYVYQAMRELPYRFTVAVQHCVDQGLIYYNGRQSQ